jgi:DNA-binding NarL/FixJ family response regulator
MAAKETAEGFMLVAVVDDDENTRTYFRDILQSVNDFKFVGDFQNATEALTGIPPLQPDIVLMNICMSDLNGIECTKRLMQVIPPLKVIVMTGDYNPSAIMWSLRVGAAAHLIKPITKGQCLATLRFVAVNEARNNQKPEKSRRIFPRAISARTNVSLSPREKDVMTGLAEGLLYKEISQKLGISYSAVHKYQHKLFQKLQVSNRSEAITSWLGLTGE